MGKTKVMIPTKPVLAGQGRAGHGRAWHNMAGQGFASLYAVLLDQILLRRFNDNSRVILLVSP